MDVTVSYEHGEEAVSHIDVAGLALLAMEHEGVPESTEASITFVDNAEIQRLNREYRGIDAPTDVLSFECDGLEDGFEAGEGQPYQLGDVIIATDVALAQTHEYGTSIEEEVELLVVHGVLHLCGYDHMEDAEAEEMEALERTILASWAKRKEANGA